MDNLANQLRDDANQIDCRVSDELDRRIRATLEGVKPVAPEKPRRETRHPAFWWASSLTGVVGAILVIVVLSWVVEW